MAAAADRRSSPRGGRGAGSRLAGLLAIAAFGSFIAACSPSPVTPGPSGPVAVRPSGSPASSPSTPPSPTTVPSPSVSPVSWSDCGLGFSCATVDVPLDYSDPTGASIHIAIVRLGATDQSRRIGSLLVNPGGPGASGIDFVRDEAAKLFPAEIRKRFDIVGFDPRGIGASTEIRCVDNLEHFIPTDLTPETPAKLTALVDGAKGFAEGCAQRNADLLGHLSTADAARDLDLIRASLGEDKLTYVGFSYGTLLGATYASLFPTRVRALVLDGAIDPSLDLVRVRKAQSVAFQASFDSFLAECAKTRTCAFNFGAKTRATFEALMRKIEATGPVPTPELPDRQGLYPADAWSAILNAMYSRESWPLLAQGLRLAALGDGSILLAMSDPYRGRKPNGAYSNEPDAFAAYTCLDFHGPTELSQIAANAAAWARAAPDFGPILAYSDLACAYWGHPPVRTAAPISDAGAPPVVVIGSTGDPATPYTWAVALAHQLDGAVLITRRGDGHTGYPFSTCVEKAADDYLLTLTLPKAGLTCASDS